MIGLSGSCGRSMLRSQYAPINTTEASPPHTIAAISRPTQYMAIAIPPFRTAIPMVLNHPLRILHSPSASSVHQAKCGRWVKRPSPPENGWATACSVRSRTTTTSRPSHCACATASSSCDTPLCNAGGKPELPLGSARGFDLSSVGTLSQDSRPGSEGLNRSGCLFWPAALRRSCAGPIEGGRVCPPR